MRILVLTLMMSFLSHHSAFGAEEMELEVIQLPVDSSQDERNKRYLNITKNFDCGDKLKHILALFDKGIDVNYGNPLIAAIEKNNYRFIYAMTEIYTDNDKKHSKLTPDEIIKWKHLRQFLNINATNKRGETALILLAKKNEWNIISSLVKGKLEEDSETPLKVSYSTSLDIDHQDNLGRTALIWAMKKKSWNRVGVSSAVCGTLEILLKNGANPETSDREGKTIFDIQPSCGFKGDLYKDEWNPTFNRLREERG